MVDISLILPTRHRRQQLERAMQSLLDTARRPERIEVVLYVDADDHPSQQFQIRHLQMQMLIGPRVSMGAMTRRCYQSARGRCLMLANDDIVFWSPDWDARILDVVDSLDDGVALVWGNNLLDGAPEHPFLPRVVCESMGQICPASYDRQFIDIHIYDVFRKLRQLGHDRMRFLPDVVIEHRDLRSGKAQPDQTYVKPHPYRDEQTYIAWEEERWGIAERLSRRILQYSAHRCGDLRRVRGDHSAGMSDPAATAIGER